MSNLKGLSKNLVDFAGNSLISRERGLWESAGKCATVRANSAAGERGLLVPATRRHGNL